MHHTQELAQDPRQQALQQALEQALLAVEVLAQVLAPLLVVAVVVVVGAVVAVVGILLHKRRYIRFVPKVPDPNIDILHSLAMDIGPNLLYSNTVQAVLGQHSVCGYDSFLTRSCPSCLILSHPFASSLPNSLSLC